MEWVIASATSWLWWHIALQASTQPRVAVDKGHKHTCNLNVSAWMCLWCLNVKLYVVPTCPWCLSTWVRHSTFKLDYLVSLFTACKSKNTSCRLSRCVSVIEGSRLMASLSLMFLVMCVRPVDFIYCFLSYHPALWFIWGFFCIYFFYPYRYDFIVDVQGDRERTTPSDWLKNWLHYMCFSVWGSVLLENFLHLLHCHRGAV